ncbi:hypothetical protein BJ508DRAFT_324085 [Ascobolus immersus RN42]|uniref:Uncharacterized protein n=1 Tax=Ascobolus immersus RN42 TaxID=1160509 RepID=A0A3N4IE91_ASCIM|nr:hypothetical protein BJ508DRAFT_324085 [Ascobolus immersus RN42]
MSAYYYPTQKAKFDWHVHAWERFLPVPTDCSFDEPPNDEEEPESEDNTEGEEQIEDEEQPEVLCATDKWDAYRRRYGEEAHAPRVWATSPDVFIDTYSDEFLVNGLENGRFNANFGPEFAADPPLAPGLSTTRPEIYLTEEQQQVYDDWKGRLWRSGSEQRKILAIRTSLLEIEKRGQEQAAASRKAFELEKRTKEDKLLKEKEERDTWKKNEKDAKEKEERRKNWNESKVKQAEKPATLRQRRKAEKTADMAAIWGETTHAIDPETKQNAPSAADAPPKVEKPIPSFPWYSKALPAISTPKVVDAGCNVSKAKWRNYYTRNRVPILRFLKDYYLINEGYYRPEKEARSEVFSYDFIIEKICASLGLDSPDKEKRCIEFFQDGNPETEDVLSTSRFCPVFVLARAVCFEAEEEPASPQHDEYSPLYPKLFRACFYGDPKRSAFSTKVAQLHPKTDWLYPECSFPKDEEDPIDYDVVLTQVWNHVAKLPVKISK